MKNFIILIISISFINNSFINAQDLDIDSLRKAYAENPLEETKVLIFFVSIAQHLNNNPDSLLYYTNQLNSLPSVKNDFESQIKVYNSYATYYYKKGNYDSAVYYHEKNLETVKKEGTPGRGYFILTNLGVIYFQKANYEKALYCFLECLKEAEKLEKEADISGALNNTALVYYRLKNFSKSLEYHFKALKLNKSKNDKNRMASSFVNIGVIYEEEENFDSAMYYYDQCLAICNETNNSFLMASVQFNISNIYSHKNNFDSAQWYMEQSLINEQKNENKFGIAECYIGLSDIQFNRNKYSQALSFAKKAQPIFEEMEANEELANCLYSISLCLEKIGNYKKAFEELEKSKKLNDKIFSEISADALSEMQVKFETEKKEKELLIQQTKLNEQTYQISQQQTYRNIAIGGFLIISILALLIYRNFRIKSKSNQIISSKNIQLDKTLKERESLLKEIHHRVKNNLQVIASLLYLQSEKSDNQDIKKILEDGQGRVRSMALIHQKLYENDDLKSIPFEEYLKELISEIQFSFGDLAKNVQLEVEAKDIFFDVDTAIPLGLIINELSTNAFKYAFSNQESPVFKISLKKNGEREYYLKVSDNGNGIPDHLINSVKPNSLGLKLTKMLSRQLEGEYQFDNQNGTSFNLRFAG